MKWENTTAKVEKPKNFNLKLITVYTVCKGENMMYSKFTLYSNYTVYDVQKIFDSPDSEYFPPYTKSKVQKTLLKNALL